LGQGLFTVRGRIHPLLEEGGKFAELLPRIFFISDDDWMAKK
jgi:hypothetical protein